MSILDAILRREEGKRLTVYKDTLGFLTVGIGHKVTPEDDLAVGDRITDLEAEDLFADDIKHIRNTLRDALEDPSWFDTIGEGRQAVLQAMAFQMGIHGMLGFRKTIDFLKRYLWDEAAEAMLDSKWAQQTPERAKRMAHIIRTNDASEYINN